MQPTIPKSDRLQVQNDARPNELAAKAMSQGMRTVRQVGIEKVLAAVFTIEEVRATSN